MKIRPFRFLSKKIFVQIAGFVNDGTWTFNHDDDGMEQNIGKCLSGHRNKNDASIMRIR